MYIEIKVAETAMDLNTEWRENVPFSIGSAENGKSKLQQVVARIKHAISSAVQTLCEPDVPEVPEVLAGDKLAMDMLDRCVEAGWIDRRYQLTKYVSKTFASIIAFLIGRLMSLGHRCWQPFERLWDVTGLGDAFRQAKRAKCAFEKHKARILSVLQPGRLPMQVIRI